jgi:serine carboxypeptidase-like clade 2
VRRVPGWGRLDFNMYSGSMPVSKDKELFYVYVEAEEEPSKAPVVLWLTG